MEIEMRVYPKPLEIGDMEGFTPEKDLFNRAELGKGMSHLVATVEDPLVIAFDGPWGSGKTTFLKMWAGELRKAGHPVIFFDAFENDYVEDAFAALAREVVELAESKTSTSSAAIKSFREKTAKLGVALLKGGLKVGAKIVIRAATAGLGDASDIKEIAEDVEKEADDAAKRYFDDLLDSPRKQKEIVKEFRNALEALPALLAPTESEAPHKPLIFIIDELDRCKPHFALALLERIKHFMAVPNVHFVLGVRLSQLQSSVKYSYGSSIDATSYLQKFINLTIHNIDTNEKSENSALKKYTTYLIKKLEIQDSGQSSISDSIPTILRLSNIYEVSFRTVERAFTLLALATGMTPKNTMQLGTIMGGLVMMKIIRPELFLKAKTGSISFADASAFLQFAPEIDRPGGRGWEELCWQYFLSDELTPDTQDVGRTIGVGFFLRNRREAIVFTANYVIDRLSPELV